MTPEERARFEERRAQWREWRREAEEILERLAARSEERHRKAGPRNAG